MGDDFEKYASRNIPRKTMLAPVHCFIVKEFPNKSTDAKTVKNFLVVVINDTSRGPNSDTCKKTMFN